MIHPESAKAEIMVVEDEVLVADDIAETLIQMGYGVTSVVSSGEEAVRQVRKQTPDLILMDIMLRGDMDGIETAATIRSEQNIPVIFLTAYGDDEILERARITEPYGYLIKPFEERELHINISIALYKAAMEKKLRQMEEELIRAKKMETAAILAGGMAHDFNNLMFVILGNIGLAKESIPPGESISNYLQEAESALLQARELTRKYIAFSAPGTMARLPEPLKKILEKLLSDHIYGAAIRCTFHMPDADLRIQADKPMIRKALGHIIQNAREAMPEGGTLRIDVQKTEKDGEERIMYSDLKPGSYAEIRIQDSGRGIAKENVSKVFDPYYSTKERGSQKGMGLGLSLTHAIIRGHEGHIRIESQKGEGTSVFVYLPIAEEGE